MILSLTSYQSGEEPDIWKYSKETMEKWESLGRLNTATIIKAFRKIKRFKAAKLYLEYYHYRTFQELVNPELCNKMRERAAKVFAYSVPPAMTKARALNMAKSTPNWFLQMLIKEVKNAT